MRLPDITATIFLGSFLTTVCQLMSLTLCTPTCRKSLSLRKTKTDRVDARTIATMLLSDVDLKSYTDIAYHNEELKSLTRYRFDKVQECAKLKQSVSRLATILFPELEGLVSSIHGTSIYALLSEYPGAKQISEVHLTKLTNLLTTASKGRYGKKKSHPDSRGSQSFYWLCHACQKFLN